MCGCSTTLYQLMDVSQHEGRSLSVVYVPTIKEVYVEIFRDGKRYSEFEVSVGLKALEAMSASGVGAWAGRELAVLRAPSNVLVAINPIAAAAAILIRPSIEGAIEASKQSTARRRAEPFNDLLPPENGQAYFYSILESALKKELGNIPSRIDTYFAGSDSGPFEKKQEFENLNSDLILLLNSVAAFSPQFDTLQISLLYGVFDRKDGFTNPIYTNAVFVQSKIHAGKLGDDTRDEIDKIVDDWLQARFKVIDRSHRNSGNSVHAMARLDAINKAKRKRSSQNYNPIDDHDPEGELWLEDEGAAFRKYLAEGYTEAAYLLANDLVEKRLPDESSLIAPPGYDRAMHRVPHLDHADRVVYRLQEGPLVSVDSRSRFVPLNR